MAHTKSNSAPVIFKTIRKFKTDDSFIKQIDPAKIPIITFDVLDELIIIGRLNESIFRFLITHPNITKFTLSTNWIFSMDITTEDALRLTKALPLATKVILERSTLTTDTAIEFINNCKLLTHFEFEPVSHDEYLRLKNSLETEWQSSFTRVNSYTIIVKLQR